MLVGPVGAAVRSGGRFVVVRYRDKRPPAVEDVDSIEADCRDRDFVSVVEDWWRGSNWKTSEQRRIGHELVVYSAWTRTWSCWLSIADVDFHLASSSSSEKIGMAPIIAQRPGQVGKR